MYSQAPITNEKDGPSQLEIPGTTGGTKSSTNGVPDTTPQDLGNKRGILRQGYINDTETRSSSLSDDDILRLEELPNTGPQVRLSNNVVGLVWDGEGEWKNRDLLSSVLEFGQLGRQVGEESLEADPGVKRVQNSGMVGVKLIREISVSGQLFKDLPVPRWSCSLGCGT